MRRWALGRVANLAFRAVTGIRGVTDVTTTFRVARVEVIRQLDLDSLPADLHALQMAFVATAVARGLRVGGARSSTARRPRRPRCKRPGHGRVRAGCCRCAGSPVGSAGCG